MDNKASCPVTLAKNPKLGPQYILHCDKFRGHDNAELNPTTRRHYNFTFREGWTVEEVPPVCPVGKGEGMGGL